MKKILHIPVSIRSWLDGKGTFSAVMHLQGKAFRDVKGRKTIQVKLGGHSYFVKQHFGVGWGEIFKNLLSFKVPILGAMTEVYAIQALNQIGIPTTPLVAYGRHGRNPAKLQSFVMTQDLGDIVSLEELCADWLLNPPDAAFKQQLIVAVATLAAKLHRAGLCHRDFYLCHFVLKRAELDAGVIQLYLIDLHRMLQRQAVDGAAVMKDMAGLYFSAMECGLDAADIALFKQHYQPQTDAFWQQVCARAKKLYAKFNSEKFQKRLAAEKSAIR
jgi:UDP-glucose:(heptosyl)LPS alpha-1,3-glucosyltransferase/heptose I phosphotransferase